MAGVNKQTSYTADGKEIGFVTSIQSDKIIVTSGLVSPDRFLIQVGGAKP
jgi:hypothetical protein